MGHMYFPLIEWNKLTSLLHLKRLVYQVAQEQKYNLSVEIQDAS